MPSELPLLAQIPSTTSKTFIAQNPVSQTYKPAHFPTATPPPTPVYPVNSKNPELSIPFTHTIEDWKLKLDDNKKEESHDDHANFVLDSVEDRRKT